LIVVSNLIISKKLFDSSIFIDEKNSNIENWLSIMKNKLKENVDWYSIETQKKAYVRIKIEENAMKHLTSKFKKDFIKSFLIVENMFDDLNKMFDDSNKRVNALKTYRRLKQIKMNKKLLTFWAEF
jgi:hypothetical protein